MIKVKKRINWNLISILFGSLVAILLGLIFGLKNSMLAKATAFPNSNVKYNEQVKYCNSTKTGCLQVFYNSNNQYYYIIVYSINNPNVNYIYERGTYSNGVITTTLFRQLDGYADGTVATTVNITINSDNIVFNNTTFTEDYSGYSEEQYLAYGQQQYTAGQNSVLNNPNTYNLYTSTQYNNNYTAGQNSVLNNPNTYNLYTSTQYNNYGTTQYNSGYSAGSTAKENDVLNNPNNYGLYSSAQYTSYGTSQYNAGINYVLNNPSLYNLYTSSQYTAYGTSQYNTGFTSGQNDVINNPHNYNLYTTSEYNSNYTAGQNNVINNPHTYDLYTTSEYNAYGNNQYNAGYLAGLNDNEAYNLGIQHVLNNPHDYNLYTESEYNTYGTNQYNAGINYVLNNLNEYGLYTTAQYNAYGSEQFELGVNTNSGIEIDTAITYSDENPELFDSFNSKNYINYSNGLLWFDNLNYEVADLENNFNTESYYTDITLINSLSTKSDYVFVTRESIGGLIYFYNNSTLIYTIDISDSDTLCKSFINGECVFNLSDFIDTNIYSSFNKLRVWSANFDYYVRGFGLANNPYYQGYNNGYDIGYSNGIDAGKEIEQPLIYNAGYNAGILYATDNNDNSLVGMVGAVATTPVTLLTTIFNFEFLGINIAGFILSIITLLVVIWLIKRFI